MSKKRRGILPLVILDPTNKQLRRESALEWCRFLRDEADWEERQDDYKFYSDCVNTLTGTPMTGTYTNKRLTNDVIRWKKRVIANWNARQQEKQANRTGECNVD
jgi:hypothetical protein